MDVSPKLLREVEFREQWRGYSPDEVDDFLERLAVALEQFQVQLHDATEQAARAEQRLVESSASEDEIRRTLVLAQRTADAARQEAEEEAKKALDDARTEARRLVAEARARAARVDREARDAARAELNQLIMARQALAGDVEALEQFLAERRSALRDLLEESRRMLDDPSRLGAAAPPALTDVEVSEPPPSVTDEDADADATQVHPEARPHPENGVARRPDAVASPEPEAEPEPESVPEPAAPAEVAPPSEMAELPSEPDEDAWKSFASQAAEEDDPFLAELRRAVTDPEPLGPRDHVVRQEGESEEDVELYDQDLAPSTRFRLRRRR